MDHPFAPVFDESSATLILGSFPSVKSRADGFYYGHPRNRFWLMLADIFGEIPPTDIPQKRALLLRHQLALWDVIASCEITGSADTSVRDAQPVNIARVNAPIDRVLCNGALAGKLYVRYLQPVLGIAPIVLPSTSPANAAWSMDRLTDAWRVALCEKHEK